MAIPPASGAPPPPTPALPLPPGNTGTIVQLPPTLGPVQAGDVIEGLIAAQLANGSVTVDTPAGPIILRTGLALAQDTAVLLRVTAGGEQPAVAVTLARPAATPAPVAEAAAPAAAAAPASANLVVATVTRSPARAIPQAAPAAAHTPLATIAALPAGTKLPLRILSVTPPPQSQAQPGAATATATATPTTTTAPHTQAQASTAFPATVKGTNLFGQPVLQAGAVELTLPPGRPLPAGGNLLLEKAGLPLPPPVTGTDSQALALAPRWEALHEVLAHAAPALQAAVAQAVPQPTPQLAGSLLFFLAALRGGDPRHWLGGDLAKALERDGLLRRLGDEFGLMQRIATQPAGQDWRLYLIPFLAGEQLQQLRLFVRSRPEGGGTGDEGGEPGTRFVIEANFSRLGAFQFDGLVRRRHLTLVIRTEAPLDEAIHRDITGIYHTSLQALGFAGSVDFRAERFFEVRPLAESGLAHAGVTA